VASSSEDTLIHAGLKFIGDSNGAVCIRCRMQILETPVRHLLRADGFWIGSNDMTQLVLGLDPDSSLFASSFDEHDPAVLAALEMAIKACLERGKYVGICGPGPSDHPELAEWLLQHGIESMSLNPDTVVDTWLHLAKTARDLTGGRDTATDTATRFDRQRAAADGSGHGKAPTSANEIRVNGDRPCAGGWGGQGVAASNPVSPT
jgi:hypothetical protein